MQTTSAINYHKVATGYWQALNILKDHVRIEGKRYDPVLFAYYNTVGFAIELFLKSILASSGISSLELSRKPFGHNLAELLKEAKVRGIFDLAGIKARRGIDITPGAVEELVRVVSIYHSNYTYRYADDSDPGFQVWPFLDHISDIVLDLMARSEDALDIRDD